MSCCSPRPIRDLENPQARSRVIAYAVATSHAFSLRASNITDVQSRVPYLFGERVRGKVSSLFQAARLHSMPSSSWIVITSEQLAVECAAMNTELAGGLADIAVTRGQHVLHGGAL